MKKLAAAIAAIALIGTPAFAADMPVKAPPSPPPAPVYNWTGWYVGGNIGYSWGRSSGDWDVFAANVNGATTCTTVGVLGALCASGSDSHNLNGAIGGLQAGYNWQMANYLAGLEADIQISDQKGSSSSTDLFPTTVPPVDGIAAITHTERLLWFGTVRGRVGAIFDRWLVYGTGGLAYGALKTDGTAIATGSPGCSPVVGCPFQPLANWTNTSINLGWTIGAGIEGAVNNYWTLKVEYLYVDLGNLDTNFATTSGLFGNFNTGNGGLIRVVAGNGTIHSNVTDNIVRVGLNYQFH